MASLSTIRRIYRIFLKHWKTLTLNVVGMAMGISVSLLLGSYCLSEYNYDSFHKNASSIYQLWATVQMDPNTTEVNRFSAATAETILNTYPDISFVVRTASTTKATLTSKMGLKLEEKNILFSEAGFFDIFSFPLINGSLTSFHQPNFIIISDQISRKYYGNQDPTGEIVLYNDTLALQIAGVFKSHPDHSTFQFDFVISFPTIRNFQEFKNDFVSSKFGLGRFKTYLLIPHVDIAQSLPELLPKIDEGFKISSYHLEPLNGAHVRNYGNGNESNVPLFSLIAIIIFVVVVVNSMNVTISLCIERTKEIIVRKINGANRWQIILMFFQEAFWLSFASLLFSFLIIIVIKRPVENALGIPLELNMLLDRPFVFWMATMFLLMTFTGALYPGIVLSTTKPVLSSNFNTSIFASSARRISLLMQLVVSTTLITGALLVSEQIDFVKYRNLGITLENVLVFRLFPEDANNYPTLRNELNKLSVVSEVGAANHALFQEELTSVIATRADSLNSTVLSLLITDQSFMKVLDIPTLKGEFNSRTNGIVLNQKAANSLSINGNLNDHKILMGNSPTSAKAIVKDFNFSNPRNEIGNLGITIVGDSSSVFSMTGCYVYVKFNDSQDLAGSLQQIEKVCNERVPQKPISYSFLQDNYFQNFKTESGLLDSLQLFSLIAILVSAFGLAGFILFLITGKMLEISIRKVLGANIIHIIISLLKQLLVFVLISLAIGIPLSLYLTKLWLQSFVLKGPINPVIVIYGGTIVLLIVLIVSVLLILPVINSNPIKFLRKE